MHNKQSSEYSYDINLNSVGKNIANEPSESQNLHPTKYTGGLFFGGSKQDPTSGII